MMTRRPAPAAARQWYLLPPTDANGGAYRDQTFTGVFSPDAATDRGMIFVTGNIGSDGNGRQPEHAVRAPARHLRP